VQATEITKVLAKRLFTDIDQQAARETAEAYMAMYRRSAAALPDRASREDFREALVAHYPFHPTFIARSYWIPGSYAPALSVQHTPF
jgi:predicted AAA+ superfamily ATPase